MDGEDVFAYGFVIAIFMGALLVGGFIVHGIWVSPMIGDNAQSSCVNSGFETFISYTQYPFSKQPKALYCGSYEERMIKEGKIRAYTTSNNNSMILSDVGTQQG